MDDLLSPRSLASRNVQETLPYGFYGKQANAQRSLQELVNRTNETLMEAFAELEIHPNDNLVIVDYGSADGKNSITSWVPKVVLFTRSKRQESASIHFVFNDLPLNDWNFFWRESAPSYLSTVDQRKIFFSSIGRSFYEQILPANTVSFGVCGTNSVHWTSSIPVHIKGTVNCHLSTNEDELLAWKELAKADWDQMLRHRSKELKKGGRLVLTGICLKVGEINPILNKMNETIHELVKEGLLSEQVLDQITHPTYLRTEEEYRNYDKDIPLKLIKCQTFFQPSYSFAQYKQHGDLDRFADAVCGTFKGVQAGTLKNLLLACEDESRVNVALDRYWKILKQKVMASAEAVGRDGYFILMVFGKN